MKAAMNRFGLTRTLILAGALALAGIGAAQAFTLQDGSGNSGGQAFTDFDSKSSRVDVPASRFDGQSRNTIQSGNTSVQFSGPQSGGSFNQRYNPSNMFDPYARDGR